MGKEFDWEKKKSDERGKKIRLVSSQKMGL
jgi:hypothetical protein